MFPELLVLELLYYHLVLEFIVNSLEITQVSEPQVLNVQNMNNNNTIVNKEGECI